MVWGNLLKGRNPPKDLPLRDTKGISSSHRHTRDWENDVQDYDVYNLRPIIHTEISTTDKE